jgi:hypothetical protein
LRPLSYLLLPLELCSRCLRICCKLLELTGNVGKLPRKSSQLPRAVDNVLLRNRIDVPLRVAQRLRFARIFNAQAGDPYLGLQSRLLLKKDVLTNRESTGLA